MNRRNFFLTALAPLIAKWWPKPKVKPFFDEISFTTLKHLRYSLVHDQFGNSAHLERALWFDGYGERLAPFQRQFNPGRLPG